MFKRVVSNVLLIYFRKAGKMLAPKLLCLIVVLVCSLDWSSGVNDDENSASALSSSSNPTVESGVSAKLLNAVKLLYCKTTEGEWFHIQERLDEFCYFNVGIFSQKVMSLFVGHVKQCVLANMSGIFYSPHLDRFVQVFFISKADLVRFKI